MKIHERLNRILFFRLMPLILIITISVMAPAQASSATARSDADFTKVTLKNGMTFIYRVMKDQPMISINAFFRIGMNRETEKGIAHLVEHLVFRGGSGYGFDDIAGVTNRAGGQFNGFTTINATSFNFTTPKENFIDAFKIFNSSLWKTDFSETPVALEKKIVIHELDMDYGERYQDYPIYRYFFPEFSYTEKTVAEITTQNLEEFHMSNYQPINATYVITGDFDPGYVSNELEKVSNIYGVRELPKPEMHELNLPEKDVTEERNLYPFQFQVFMVYQFKGLSESERAILKLLAQIYQYDAKIDYEKNEYKVYQIVHRSLNDVDYFGIYYLERNHPYSDAQYAAEKKNMEKYIREFKKIDLVKELNNVTQQIELEAISGRESAEAAASYEVNQLTDSDALTTESLPVLKKIKPQNLDDFVDKYLNQPPRAWILVKTVK